MIRILDLFHLPTRVLRAFVAGRCALCQMRTMIGRKRIREEKFCLRGEACFICVKHCINR